MTKPYQKPHPPVICTVVAPYSRNNVAREAEPISQTFITKMGKTPTSRRRCNQVNNQANHLIGEY